MSNKAKANAYSAANIDDASLNELNAASHVGIFDDLAPLITFVQKGFLPKILTNLSYFSSVNNIGQVANISKALVKVLDSINYVLNDKNLESRLLSSKLALLEQRERLAEFYSELSKNHLKVVYKMFGLRKPDATIGVTRLLIALCEFEDQSVFSEFLDNFDFGHSLLPKIIVPTRDDFDRKILNSNSMRCAVIELWIAICSRCSSTFRKALLTNFKVMNNFWKYMEMERYESLNKIIEFLTKYVLDEKSFKRSSKCQILNENFLYNFRTLFSLVTNDNTRSDDDDMEDFSTFKSSFTEFMNVLVSDQARGISYPQNEFGSLLTVNNKDFKINNKLIYTLLTALKPWDSYTQLQYVMVILNHNSELLPPYMNWIVTSSGGYHDPSLSSYWIGHTLLYTEILKSTSLPVQFEFVSLAPLSKNAMTDCLTFPNDLVKQLGLQLILLQLTKLSEAGSVPQSVIELVISNLPVHASLIPLLTHENKIIKLTSTMIVRKLEQVAPTSSSSAIVSLIGTNLSKLNLDDGTCDSFELVLLDNYLSIQSNNDLKWWNKSPKGNSFFTSLLKLSNMVSLKSKLFQILLKLTKTSLIFHDKRFVESPLLMLIESTSKFRPTDLVVEFWNCLDETISRTIKTPYKYLDKSHLEYEDVSIFIVALFEQLQFIPDVKNNKPIMTWLNLFMKNLVIVGDNLATIKKVAADNGFELEISLSEIEPKQNIITKFDFAEGVLVFNRLIASKGNSAKVFNLATKLGNFLVSTGLSDPLLYNYVSNPDKWTFLKNLTSSSISESEIIGTTLLSEMLQQLQEPLVDSSMNSLVYGACKTELPKKNQSVLNKMLWILSVEQIQELSGLIYFNELLIVNVYKRIIDLGIEIVPDFSKLMKITSNDMTSILQHFKPPIEQIDLVLDNSHFHFLIENPSRETIEFLLQSKDIDDDVLYRVAPYSAEIVDKYQSRVMKLALGLLNWSQSMKIFSSYMSLFDSDEVLSLVLNHVKDKQKLTMTADFAQFVTKTYSSGQLPEDLKLWFHKAMIYITKKFAEASNLSENFDAFLLAMELFVTSVKDPWKMIPSSVINTQFEVLLRHKLWPTKAKYLSYANKVILKAEPKDISSDKLLQIFVNNEDNILNKLPVLEEADARFQSALLIQTLFKFNVSKSATMTLLNQLLGYYLGSIRSEDLLIKQVLKGIEKKTTQSWVNQVTNWDFLEEITQKDLELIGEERLFIKDHANLVVALNKNFVQNTVNNMRPVPAVPESSNYNDYVNFFLQCTVSSYQETIYDSEFLLLVVINNDELVHEDDEGKMVFNLTKLAESGLLGFIVTALSNPSVRDISKIILYGILKYIDSLDTNFKDKNILKVYVSSILHTMRIGDHLTPMVWYMIGSMASIITNPSHFLYDRIYRYILSTPLFKEYEIPLLNTIMFSLKNDDSLEEDNYYNQAMWLVEQLTHGAKTTADLKAIRFKAVVELILNLCNSNYVTNNMKSKVLNLLYAIQNIGKEGLDMLVTKFGALSSLEAFKHSLDTSSFSGVQLALNVDQVALRFGVLANEQKRVREWTSDDVQQAVKRIHGC